MTGKLVSSGLSSQDWNKKPIVFGTESSMQKLIGIMLSTYEIKKSIEDLNSGGQPLDRSSIARLIIDWVNGRDLASISARLYPNIESYVEVLN